MNQGKMHLDIVAHCGNSASGEFNWTLNATDIYSQWSESVCIVNKSEHEVINAIEEIKRRLPFKIKTINSDNGSEFINWHLLRYCKRENIILTRTRPYKKDDNAYIEQKNWTNVRKLLGWERYEGKEVADLINDLYSNELRLYFNLFMPSVKLIEVKRIGSRIKKIYEEPKTPLQRLSEKYLKDEKIKKLMELKSQLNPFELAKKIEEKLEKIYQKKCKKIKSPKTQKREEMLNKIKEWLKKEKNYLWLDYF
ncbi:MAG: transposase family protein [Elusimicrobiota bacterium]|nr:transposase family protein [Endomicrobiia bacterium]MDW8166767.1 transposase family protein [Elusimicrobiota bacterium]